MTEEQKPGFIDTRYANRTNARIAGFLVHIGLKTEPATLSEPTFLDGLTISHGTLLVDEARLTHPGDLLHEAGHLAIASAKDRGQIHHNAGGDPGEEMMAIAWSYAAALYIEIDPAVVFHAEGYSGGGRAIVENFSQGRYFGVPLLEWHGLTADKKNATLLNVPPYPHMLKWLRD
jgi:hypothetical protein